MKPEKQRNTKEQKTKNETYKKHNNPTNGKKTQQPTKVWQFTQDDVQESDLIDTDDLLDDLDLKKPTLVDKFDCGTSSSGKKKACKNCSCGLADELENEAVDKQKKNVETVKSSCGSCYLGDAFRCASCPYLGMPAFKPGEKVAMGASGGKDSTVLMHVMSTLNQRYNYGLNLELVSVDEGISGYRDDSLETVKLNSSTYNLPLTIVSYKDLYGWTMDEIVKVIGLTNNCTFCGVFRR